MSTYMYAHVEVQEGSGRYVGAFSIYPGFDQDYQLFAVLAGVRNEEFGVKPVREPRNLPSNMSGLVRNATEEHAGSSPSWLSLPELREAEGLYRQYFGEDSFLLSWLIKAMKLLDPEETQSRLVFWFG